MINDLHNIIIKFPVSKRMQQNSREKSNLHQCMLLWKLRITSNQFKSASYEFKSTSCKLKSTSQNSKSTNGKIKSTSWETKNTSWEIISTCQEVKTTSQINKTTSQIVNMRVKRENSSFKILNFTSYKKIYFYCLENVKLKHYWFFLKNLFYNMALKNVYVTTILPSYFSNSKTQQH